MTAWSETALRLGLILPGHKLNVDVMLSDRAPVEAESSFGVIPPVDHLRRVARR
jgi:hypothetical protein